MGPFEHFAAISQVEIHNGQWVSSPTEIVAQTPAPESPGSSKKSLTNALVILALGVLVVVILIGSRRSSASG